MIYWISTKSPIKMLDKHIDDSEAEYLRQNKGVDLALLASDLKIPRRAVRSRQFRLGLREHASHKRPRI